MSLRGWGALARFVLQTDAAIGKAVYTKGHVSSAFDVPGELEDAILKMQGEVLAEEQRKNAGAMLNIKGYGKGYTKESIEVSNLYTRGGIRYIQIRFKGKRPDGKRAAEIAFFNEFGIGSGGGERMTARGFIAKANATKQSELEEIAADQFAQWVESQLEI